MLKYNCVDDLSYSVSVCFVVSTTDGDFQIAVCADAQ